MNDLDKIILDLDVAQHKAALLAKAEALRSDLLTDPMERARAARRALQAQQYSLIALEALSVATRYRNSWSAS